MSALVFLALAGAAGWVSGRTLRGDPPFASVACTLAALVTAVVVALPLGDIRPHLLTVAVPPAAIGSLVGAFVCRRALVRLSDRRRT